MADEKKYNNVAESVEDRKLLLAAVRLDLDGIKEALKEGADINTVSEHGQTPLFFAIKNTPVDLAEESRVIEVIRFLIDRGADVHIANIHGRTSMYEAADLGRLAIVRILCEAGAGLGVADCYGETPLHRAATGGAEDVVQYILENQADAKGCVNDKGLTAADVARGAVGDMIRRFSSQGDERKEGPEESARWAELVSRGKESPARGMHS
jgi:ankyrin repeat protein